MHPRVRRTIYWLLACFGVFAVSLAFVSYELERWRGPTRAIWEQVRIGDTEQRVRSLLGPPRKEYDRENAPVEYYINGYGRPERPVSLRVLIYLDADLVMYVWIDESGKVEDIFTGHS